MRDIRQQGAQGDVLFRRVPAIPDGYVAEAPTRGTIVAHSETGHHHLIPELVTLYRHPSERLVCYLRVGADVEDGGVSVVHQRPYDTHETLRLVSQPGDVWEIRRQREHTPEGWRMVAD
jgi:hypothetical protein